MRSRKENKTKKLVKTSNYCRPVIVKKNNKFKYSKKVLSLLTGFKKKINKTNKRPKQQKLVEARPIVELQQLQLLKSSAIDDTHLGPPFLVKHVQTPQFTMPTELQVAIHKGQKIQYSDDVLYYRISTKQLLNEMSKSNKKDSDQQLNYSVPQMEISEDDYKVPDIVAKYLKSVYKVNLWIYSGRRYTDWHYDGHDNFLYVLQGKKIVYLAENNRIKSKSIFSLNNNHSDEQVTDYTNIIKAEVIPGKCLNIPKGWWHKVITYGQPSIALNFWGNSINQTLRNLNSIQKTLIIKSLLFQLSQNYCKKAILSWSTLNENQMQNFRLMAGTKIIEENKLEWN